jgi:hypothetical protein
MADGAEWVPRVPRLRIPAMQMSVECGSAEWRRARSGFRVFRSSVFPRFFDPLCLLNALSAALRRLTNWREWGIIGVRWSSLLRRDGRKTAGCCGSRPVPVCIRRRAPPEQANIAPCPGLAPGAGRLFGALILNAEAWNGGKRGVVSACSASPCFRGANVR